MAGSGLGHFSGTLKSEGSLISPLNFFSLHPIPTKSKESLVWWRGSLTAQLFFLIYFLCPKSFRTRISFLLILNLRQFQLKIIFFFKVYCSPLKAIVLTEWQTGKDNILYRQYKKASIGKKSGLKFQNSILPSRQLQYNLMCANIEVTYKLL